MLVPTVGAVFATAGMTSARGRSHTFDSRADGYARGEACGGVVIERRSNTTVLGLLGSAVRQDGRSASLTAPNGSAQRGLLLAAFGRASMSSAEIGCVEAHGTGTALGDPTEAGSLAATSLVAVIDRTRELGLINDDLRAHRRIDFSNHSVSKEHLQRLSGHRSGSIVL